MTDAKHHIPCDHSLETREIVHLMQEDMHTIRTDVKSMKEILDAWNDAKGVIRTIQLLGQIAKWIGGIAAAVGAVWLLFKKQ